MVRAREGLITRAPRRNPIVEGTAAVSPFGLSLPCTARPTMRGTGLLHRLFVPRRVHALEGTDVIYRKQGRSVPEADGHHRRRRARAEHVRGGRSGDAVRRPD